MIGIYRGGGAHFRYTEEILSHAGLAWRTVSAHELTAGLDPAAALVLPGQVRLTRDQQQRLRSYVEGGGALIVIGGTAGLDDLLGADEAGDLTEGYLQVNPLHPVTQELTSSLHVFGGRLLRPLGGQSLGFALGADRQPTGADAVVVNQVGKGVTVAIGPDVPQSVLRIQLGNPVWADGVPAPDGTCPIDENILKCDDGQVLSYEHDRERLVLAEAVPDCPGKHPDFPLGDTPWFAQPIADELRELLLRAVCWAAARTGRPVPCLDYWPAGIQAVGTISHDSDHNVDASAQTTLAVLSELGIKTTWCIMEGPTYPNRWVRQTYEQIKAAGHEIALHYNALAQDGGFWNQAEFLRQLAWLKSEAGVDRIVSNKNHYTRWEGKLEFYRWMEAAGLQSDQTRGPSKKGNVGYMFGSCQAWFPFDCEEDRFIDVLEVPMQAQDLWLTTPYVIAGQVIAMAVKHRGIAHFLFHQVHIHGKPEVTQAMRQVVADGLAAGLQWWTNEQINNWERLRRQVTVTCQGAADGPLCLVVNSPAAVSGAQLSVVLPQGSEHLANGHFHGLPALVLSADLAAGENLISIRTDSAPASVLSSRLP